MALRSLHGHLRTPTRRTDAPRRAPPKPLHTPQLEKAQADAKKGSQLKANQAAMSIKCHVCLQQFICTVRMRARARRLAVRLAVRPCRTRPWARARRTPSSAAAARGVLRGCVSAYPRRAPAGLLLRARRPVA